MSRTRTKTAALSIRGRTGDGEVEGIVRFGQGQFAETAANRHDDVSCRERRSGQPSIVLPDHATSPIALNRISRLGRRRNAQAAGSRSDAHADGGRGGANPRLENALEVRGTTETPRLVERRATLGHAI